jgi:hypothetical protein
LEKSKLDSTKLGGQAISPTQNPLAQNSTSLRQLGVDRGTDTLVEQRSFGQKDASKDERILGQNSSSIEQSPSTEGRDASVLECSAGKSDVPTPENPFEQENTTPCAESIQSSFVENNESRQHNPLTLENSALVETLHFKQDDSVVHLESLPNSGCKGPDCTLWFIFKTSVLSGIIGHPYISCLLYRLKPASLHRRLLEGQYLLLGDLFIDSYVVYCVKSFLTFSFILGSWFSSKLSRCTTESSCLK